MPTRREDVLAATIEVLAAAGGHGLTHRAVDRRAGLPEGTTSNYFRTRDALLVAALAQLSEVEAAALDGLGGDLPADPRAFADTIVAMIEFLLGPGRTVTVARHALFLEATVHAGLRPALIAASERWWTLVATMLRHLGCDRPQLRARAMLAYVDGVLADQLARPERDFDVRAVVEFGLDGLLGDRTVTA